MNVIKMLLERLKKKEVECEEIELEVDREKEYNDWWNDYD